MEIIKVNTAKPYNVYIGDGLIDIIGEYAAKLGSKIMVVTDDIVDGICGRRVTDALAEIKGVKAHIYVFKNGEDSKNKDTLFGILEELSRLKFDRNDALIALGGGVVGDITGFAAGVYMRGIKYAQIPTTLLSAIDSSVGGKTAINLGVVKNQIGVFNQPEFVIIDTAIVKNCPDEVFLDGMGEGVKYAILCGGRAAEIVQNKSVRENFGEFVKLCVEYKANIVSQDEKESGLRRLLNLGHTIGHAIEALSAHGISHGTAVAYGIYMLTGALSLDGVIERGVFESIASMIKGYFKLSKLEYRASDIVEVIKNDKKADGGHVKVVYPINIGNTAQKDIDFDDLEKLIENFQNNGRGEF